MALQLIKRPTCILSSHFKNFKSTLNKSTYLISLNKLSPERQKTISLQNIRNIRLTQSYMLSNQVEEAKPNKMSMQQKLKKAVAEYGTTVIVFHITISLLSLGTCYFLISNGFDIAYYVEKIGMSDSLSNKLATGTGTFVAAYAIHKVFAPVRIGITLTTTPFIVRYLRNKGILKK